MSEPEPHRPIVEMDGVQVVALRDPSLVVLENVNWSVLADEFWVVAGTQHSGKSDLLLHAAGLMTPTSGICRLFGRDTSELGEDRLAERLRVGYVFADGKLLNQLTITENIALPLQYHRNLPEAEIAQMVAMLMNLLDLTPYANRTPGNVAAVWRQRAALGRALALKPELLLLDNPDGSLTARHRHWLIEFLNQLWRGHDYFTRRPATIIVTTDDLHAWQHPGRKFAAVHEGTFTVLGPWGNPDFMRHQAVKELLAIPAEREGDS